MSAILFNKYRIYTVLGLGDSAVNKSLMELGLWFWKTMQTGKYLPIVSAAEKSKAGL